MRFHLLEEAMIQAGPGVTVLPKDGIRLSELRSAQKFFAGDVDQLPNLARVSAASFPRTPYAVCAIEMGMPDGRSMIVLAFDDGPDFMAMSVYESFPNDAGKQINWAWIAAIGVNRNGNQFRYSYPLDDGTLSPVEFVSCVTPLEANNVFDGVGLWHVRAVIFNLGLFLTVLNCVNVKTQVIEAPAKLNKKRVRSGKPPLYTYKTLVLGPPPALRLDHGGTHASPAVHLRRGHIKHRKTGDFWWQPCLVVGDPTRVVMKDYRADKLGGATT